MISQQTIQNIKDQANLVEIIGESVSLRHQGSNYTGLCPFHSEKTASFSVRDTGQSYYCFGCGASGNVFTYIMETRGLSFPEAVEELASRYGIEIVYDDSRRKKSPGVKSDELYRVNLLAQKFFQKSLVEAADNVKQYVVSRGLNAQAIKTFGIGFAPHNWSSLTDFLKEKGLTDETLLKSGLIQRSAKGKLYDRFRGRLIFPIWIDAKRIVGFGGRIIPSLVEPEKLKSYPKYINSPETEVYKKSKTLFGLPQASATIRQNKEVFLVEGYTDVISLSLAGIENTVAACGTSVTEEHVKRLAQLAPRVTVIFDGDTAGRQAAAKMFLVSINSGCDISAIFLADDEDPDSFAKKHADDLVEVLASFKRRSLFDCYLDALIEKYCGQGKVSEIGSATKGKIAEELVKSISKVTNTIEKSSLIEKASSKLRIEASELHTFFSDKDDGKSTLPQMVEVTKAEESKTADINSLPRLDRELLRALITHRDLLALCINNSVLCNGISSQALRFIMEFYDIVEREQDESTKKTQVLEMLKSFGPSWLAFWKESFKMSSDERVDMYSIYRECCLSLEKAQLKQRVTEIDHEMKFLDDPQIMIGLGQEKLNLQRRLSQLNS